MAIWLPSTAPRRTSRRHAPRASQALGCRPFLDRLQQQVVDLAVALDGIETKVLLACRMQVQDGRVSHFFERPAHPPLPSFGWLSSLLGVVLRLGRRVFHSQ